jgi:hypothetical protein
MFKNSSQIDLAETSPGGRFFASICSHFFAQALYVLTLSKQ